MLESLSLIAVAIIPGYIFIHASIAKSYKIPYFTRGMLYTTLIFYGSIFSIISTVLIPYCFSAIKNYSPDALIVHIKDIQVGNINLLKQIAIITLASVISYLAGIFRTLYLNFFKPKHFYDFLKEHGSELQKLSLDVISDNIIDENGDYYVEVRSKNNKVYIGIPAEIGEPIIPGADEYFYILPIYSGYRDATDHSLKITTKYIEHYSSDSTLNIDDFAVMVNAKEIITARRFDPELFFKRFEEKKKVDFKLKKRRG